MSAGRERPSALDVTGKVLSVATAAITVGSAVYGVISGSFSTVREIVLQHPGETALWTLMFTGAGALVGCAVTRAFYKKKMDDAVNAAVRPIQDQVDRIINRENFSLMLLRGLSLKELRIIKRFMASEGQVMLKVTDACVKKLAEQGLIKINNDTYSPPDLYPFTLVDSMRSRLSEFPDVLDRAIADAEQVKKRYSSPGRQTIQ